MTFDVLDADPFAGLDTDDACATPTPKSDIVDDTMGIRFTNWTRADRTKRQIIEAIEGIETLETLDEYLIAESLMIDALFLFDSSMADDIAEAHRDQQAILKGAIEAAERTAKAAAQLAAINTPAIRKEHVMANPDFKKFVFKNVTFAWPRLDQPYRYNPNTEKSEPCPANAQGAGFSLAWTMPYSEAKGIFEEMKAHYNDCRSRNSRLPDFGTVFGLKKLKDEQGNDTETAQFTAKKGAMSNDGKINKVPTVVKADHSPLEDRAIWGGSEGHVRVLAFAATNPQDKSGGISLLLDAVVVTKAEYGGDGLGDDFGSPEIVDDLPPSADFAAQAKTDRILDDEIPF